MTVEQIVAAIRSLPVAERLRVIELAAHDVANDVSAGGTEPAAGSGVTLIERDGFLIAHGEAGATVPEELFDHRPDRDALAWSASSHTAASCTSWPRSAPAPRRS